MYSIYCRISIVPNYAVKQVNSFWAFEDHVCIVVAQTAGRINISQQHGNAYLRPDTGVCGINLN